MASSSRVHHERERKWAEFHVVLFAATEMPTWTPEQAAFGI
jgi:hypothetical protein